MSAGLARNACAVPAGPQCVLQACADGVCIELFETEVPPYLEAELDRLYGSVYATLGQYRIYDAGPAVSTYVARRDGRAISILLFRIEGSRVLVLNEVISIDSVEINRFSHTIFTGFAAARVILFRAIRTDHRRLDRPSQRINYLEDIVLQLPDSEHDYFTGLGKNTRRNIKRYSKKLQDKFGAYQFRVLTTEQVDGQLVREIIHLNHVRMEGKNKLSAITPKAANAIIEQVGYCGLVGVISINDVVCAGAISFRTGPNYFLSVIAHDPTYDDYWLGMLCCYLTICECIRRGGKEFHFLWGDYQYKYLLQGMRRDLDNLALYRSPVQILLHADIAVGFVRAALERRVKEWLRSQKHEGRTLYQLLRSADQQRRRIAHCARKWLQKLK